MRVKIKDVVPGTILMEDIFVKESVLLASKGTALTEKIIEKLNEYDVEYIDVNMSSKDEDMKRISLEYTQTIDKMKNKFEVVKLKETVEILEFEELVDELYDNFTNSNEILFYAKLLGGKDEYTLEHSINVSITAMLMGKWLNYSKKDIKILGIAAILHDIGKVLIPEDILKKPSKLLPSEFAIMKNHTKLGYQLLNKVSSMDERIKAVALSHHERINGQGYPFGLKGNAICDFARIVAICDVFDAITSKRVYKPKQNVLEGLKMVFEDSYNGLDPYYCRVFLKNAAIAYEGCEVLLSNGNIGKIIRIPSENPDEPWIAVDDELLNLEAKKGNLKVVDIF